MGAYWSSPSPDPQLESQNELESRDESDNDSAVRKAKRESELASLREDLAKKRELRLKKLNQVSEEMKSLKEELANEKARREAAEKELEAVGLRKDFKEESESTSDARRLEDVRANETLGGPSSSGAGKRTPRQTSPEAEETNEPIQPKDPIGAELGKQGILKDESNELVSKCLEELSEGLEETAGIPTTDIHSELEETKEVVKDMFEKNKRLESQVKALKDVAKIGKELLKIREIQVSELNNKLKTIEETGIEYEKEVATMRKLKSLYEERARATEAEHKVEIEREKARTTVFQVKLRLSEEANAEMSEKVKQLEEKVATLGSQVDQLTEKLSESRLEAATKSEQLYHVTSQMNLVNNLFSQVISGPEVDFDRLAVFLEENHNLINEITSKGDINNVATLAGLTGGVEGCPLNEQQNEIATNLGKVWRILVELLSQQTKTPNSQEWDSCYKSVETPKGPKLVISVSQTFIKLKDLILEKNSLIKEVSHLKKLNHHLENKMEEQESRLTLVTAELHNTWGVVNKLRTQHENLHTHEKILRYELQHKRMMLNDLKKQLEVCREQWAQAREKNSQTEKDWKQLRAEFAQRKRQQHGSAESGYEDEQSPEDTDEEKSVEDDKGLGKLSDEEEVVNKRKTENKTTDEEISGESKEEKLGKNHCEESQPSCSQNYSEQTDGIVPIDSSSQTDAQLFEDSVCSPTVGLISHESFSSNESSQDRSSQTNNVLFKDSSSLKTESVINHDSSIANTERQVDQNSFSSKMSEESFNFSSKRKGASTSSEHTSQNGEPSQTGSQRTQESNPSVDIWKMLERREARLKRMEGQTKGVLIQMSNTSQRGEEIGNKLDELHEAYGGCRTETVDGRLEEGPDCSRSEESAIRMSYQPPTNDPSQPPTNDPSQLPTNDPPQSPTNDPSQPENPLPPPDRPSTSRFSMEEHLKRKEERLKRMEESCKSLFLKMGQTSERSEEIANKLDEIHAQHNQQDNESTESNDKESDEESS